MSAPSDRFHTTQCASFFLGLSTLIAWNSIVSADDYWKYKFRTINQSVNETNDWNSTQKFFTSYLSVVCNGLFLVFLIVNAVYTKKHHTAKRIDWTLAGTIVCMMTITIFCKVDTDSWQTGFLMLTLTVSGLTSVVVGIFSGCTSGVCGFLPEMCMSSYSLGQAISGILAALGQCVCLLLDLSSRNTALIFFGITVLFLCSTFVAWKLMQESEYYRYYKELSSSSGFGQNSDSEENDRRVTLSGYWELLCQGWQFHLSAAVVMAVSTVVFPGLTYQAVSINQQTGGILATKLFIPLSGFLTFSLADAAGRYSEAMLPFPPNKRTELFVSSMTRIALIPLLMMCNLSPSDRTFLPVLIKSDLVFVILMALSGFSNGYLFNAACVNAPKSTDLHLQEHSANLLAVMYGLGATVGSVLSYFAVLLL